MIEQPTPDHIMQIGIGFWASKMLLSAVEMGLFTELAQHPKDLNAVQSRLGLHPRSARDFLDTLVAIGFLDGDRRRIAFGLMMSLNMLIETYGGFDYAGTDCQSWMREIGFRETQMEPSQVPTPWSLASVAISTFGLCKTWNLFRSCRWNIPEPPR